MLSGNKNRGKPLTFVISYFVRFCFVISPIFNYDRIDITRFYSWNQEFNVYETERFFRLTDDIACKTSLSDSLLLIPALSSLFLPPDPCAVLGAGQETLLGTEVGSIIKVVKVHPITTDGVHHYFPLVIFASLWFELILQQIAAQTHLFIQPG